MLSIAIFKVISQLGGHLELIEVGNVAIYKNGEANPSKALIRNKVPSQRVNPSEAAGFGSKSVLLRKEPAVFVELTEELVHLGGRNLIPSREARALLYVEIVPPDQLFQATPHGLLPLRYRSWSAELRDTEGEKDLISRKVGRVFQHRFQDQLKIL